MADRLNKNILDAGRRWRHADFADEYDTLKIVEKVFIEKMNKFPYFNKSLSPPLDPTTWDQGPLLGHLKLFGRYTTRRIEQHSCHKPAGKDGGQATSKGSHQKSIIVDLAPDRILSHQEQGQQNLWGFFME